MEKITLPNGLRVLLDWQSHARTASFGIWIKSGSMYEQANINGISHFIEHMVFKGTDSRSSLAIAEEMDSIGGQMNAYTCNDFTCFYARTLQEHVPQAFDILADMVTRPRFDAADLQMEKGVVLEEISMSEDQPEEHVVDNLYRRIWQDSPMGRPILGTRGSLNGLTREALSAYHKKHYAPKEMVVAICGRFPRQAFLDVLERYFSPQMEGQAIPCSVEMPYHKSLSFEYSDQEQTHLCLCLPGINYFDQRRHALSILNIIAGGSSSSRLFQRIREELGLAYSVYSSLSSYKTGGLIEVQTAVNPGADRTACVEMMRTLSQLRQGVTEKEFLRAREQLKSNLVMSMESTSARAGHMGRSELLKDAVESEDDMLNAIGAVTLEDVNRTARELIDLENLSLSVLGPSQEETFYRTAVEHPELFL